MYTTPRLHTASLQSLPEALPALKQTHPQPVGLKSKLGLLNNPPAMFVLVFMLHGKLNLQLLRAALILPELKSEIPLEMLVSRVVTQCKHLNEVELGPLLLAAPFRGVLPSWQPLICPLAAVASLRRWRVAGDVAGWWCHVGWHVTCICGAHVMGQVQNMHGHEAMGQLSFQHVGIWLGRGVAGMLTWQVDSIVTWHVERMWWAGGGLVVLLE